MAPVPYLIWKIVLLFFLLLQFKLGMLLFTGAKEWQDTAHDVYDPARWGPETLIYAMIINYKPCTNSQPVHQVMGHTDSTSQNHFVLVKRHADLTD